MTPSRKISSYSRRPEISSFRSAKIVQACPCLPISGATLRVPGFRVIETCHPANLTVRRHSHEFAQLIFVLEGRVVETYDGGREVTYLPGTLRYLPARLPHSNSFEAGSRCLVVEVERETLARSRTAHQISGASRPNSKFRRQKWLGERLHQEFLEGDSASLVSVQGILLEMLAEAARHAGSGPMRNIPEWLLRRARIYRSQCIAPLEPGRGGPRRARQPGSPGASISRLLFKFGRRVPPPQARRARLPPDHHHQRAAGRSGHRLRVFRSKSFLLHLSPPDGPDAGAVSRTGPFLSSKLSRLAGM